MDLVHTVAMSGVEVKGVMHVSGPQRPDEHVQGGEHVVALLELPDVTGVIVLRGDPLADGRWPGGQLYRKMEGA